MTVMHTPTARRAAAPSSEPSCVCPQLMTSYGAGYNPGSYSRQEDQARPDDLRNLCRERDGLCVDCGSTCVMGLDCRKGLGRQAASDYRSFDGQGRKVGVSMVWAGHTSCAGNGQGVDVVLDDHWRQNLIDKVKATEFDLLAFQVPSLHSSSGLLDVCGTAKIEKYMKFLSELLGPNRTVLLQTGAFLKRSLVLAQPIKRCNAELQHG